MGFKEDLQQICGKVDGSFAASVMGFDGIPIETHEARPPDGIEVQSLLVEYSGIVSQVRQAAETLQMGKASEVSIRTERLVAVARPLTPDYFVVLALAPEGNVGRARYELRVAGPQLVAQLEVRASPGHVALTQPSPCALTLTLTHTSKSTRQTWRYGLLSLISVDP